MSREDELKGQFKKKVHTRRRKYVRRKSACGTLILFLMCLCGNVYQISQISSIYFAYPMNTQVSVRYPNATEPPSQTVCFYLLEVFNWSQVLELNPRALDILGIHDEKNESNIITHVMSLGYSAKLSATSMITREMNVSSILSLVIPFDQIFGDIKLFDPLKQIIIMKSTDAHQHFNIRTFLRTIYVCFMFEQLNPHIYPNIKINRMFTIPGFLYQIKVKNEANDRTTNALLAYSPSSQLPRSGFYRFIKVNTEFKLFSMTYQQYENQFLPPPFETSCIKYSGDTDYQSRADCFDDCAIRSGRTYDALDQRVLPGPLLTREMGHEVPLPASDFIFKESLWSLVVKIEDQCAKDCSRIDCNTIVHVPVVQSVMERKETSFMTFALAAPATNTTFTQKLSFTEYATDLASTFGFWLGISLFSSMSFLYRIVDNASHAGSVPPDTHEHKRKQVTTKKKETSPSPSRNGDEMNNHCHDCRRPSIPSHSQVDISRPVSSTDNLESLEPGASIRQANLDTCFTSTPGTATTCYSPTVIRLPSECNSLTEATSEIPSPEMLFYRRKSSIAVPDVDLMRLMLPSEEIIQPSR